jgi:hypothetical protein
MKIWRLSKSLYLPLLFAIALAQPERISAGDVTVEGSNVGGDIVGRDKITHEARPLTLMEQAVGRWQLSSFDKTVRGGITQGIDIEEGTLNIEPSGRAQWSLLVVDRFSPSDRLRESGTGVLRPSGYLQPKKGGKYNETAWLGDRWQISRVETDLTVRGWSTGAQPDQFKVEVQGDLLSMQNSRGTLTWFK